MRYVRLMIPALIAAIALLAMTAQPARAAGLLVADGGFGGVLEIEEQDVQVTINNGVAVTRVTQVFRNTEDRQVEALYTFPVPKGASVANFSMWIGGKEMIGEVVEKERAREIYDSYKRRRVDPGLLEQLDYKTFEMRIFPIGPRAEQRVEIAYYQELEFDHDWVTYVYPLATTTRAGATDSRTRGRFALNLELASEIPIVELVSPSHGDEMALVQHTDALVQASLETREGDLNRDVVLAFRQSRPTSGIDLVASKQRGEDGYVMITLTAGEELDDPSTGMDYVFILDISGSMNEDGKLALSRDSANAFIEALGAEDRFEVLTFNVAPSALFGDLRGVESASRSDAADFLGGQRARGGTVLEPAIRSAYAYKDADRVLNVVILSDGMTEQRERQTLLRLAGQAPTSTRIFAIGVGNDVNRPLLTQLAEDAGGLAAFVSHGDDFERQARAFRRKLERPVIDKLEIVSDAAVLYDVEPRTLPNLYHGMPVRLYARYLSPGSTSLTVRGDLGGERFEQQVRIELPGDEAESPEIERMWAFHRIERLLEQADREGNRDAVVPEVVRLGEAFSIVTEYTSFLVLENDNEYKRWSIDRRNALRIERDRDAQRRVRERLTAMRDKVVDTRIAQRGDKPERSTPAATPAPRRTPTPSGGNRDVNFGGGAIDPLGASLMAGLAGAAWAARRRRRRS